MRSRTSAIAAMLLLALAGSGGPATAADSTIEDPSPQLVLDDTDPGAPDWELAADVFCPGCLDIFSEGAGSPFVIEPGAATGQLYLAALQRVGINTTLPAVPLHVMSADGRSARIRVQNPLPGSLPMLELVNAGDEIVRVSLSAGGSVWQLSNNPRFAAGAGAQSGQFRITKLGSGGIEFALSGEGNAVFKGTSTAVNHVNTSTRAVKTGFAPVDEHQVLERLATLPIRSWRYAVDASGRSHLGPVAEEFQATFGLGDGRHISTVDANGVALAAIKGLHRLVEQKDARIAALEADREALHERLARLERLLLEQSGLAQR